VRISVSGLYYLFEESELQLIRNMRTIGTDLQPAVSGELLQIESVRPTTHGLEMHLARMMHRVHEFKPEFVVVDPLSALLSSGTTGQAHIMVLRLVNYLKPVEATTLYLAVQAEEDKTELNMSSLMDTWISVKNHRHEQELDRRMYIVRSRGMRHSADVRVLSIGADGVRVIERGDA
jgi:circadian clock protein KaiC